MKKLESTLPNMILSLGIITVIAGALLGWMYSITKEPIEQQAQAQQQAAIAEVAPKFDNDPEAENGKRKSAASPSRFILPGKTANSWVRRSKGRL